MDVYYNSMSAPCRAVLLTGKGLGINWNKKVINLMNGEQMKPEYLAINFQHVVPTLADGNFNLWESRAISAYLVNAHGKNDEMYPKDPKTRAMVDRLLYFDEGTFYHRFGKFVYPVAFNGQNPDPKLKEAIYGGIEFLEKFLEGHDFAVGNSITIADHALVASYSSMVATGLFDISKYKVANAWFKRCKEQMPGYETENGVGAASFGKMIKSKFAEHN